MAEIICKVCGSKDIIREEDSFVCRGCGTKYTLAAVQKLMQEEKTRVDVQPDLAEPAKPTNEIDSLFVLARRAKEEGNSEDAEKYYNEILIRDPLSWEAAFYHTLYKAYQTNIAGISTAASTVKRAFFSTVSLLPEEAGERFRALSEMGHSIIQFATVLHSNAGMHYIKFKETTGSLAEFRVQRDNIYSLLTETGDYIYSQQGEEETADAYKVIATYLYKAAFSLDDGAKKVAYSTYLSAEEQKKMIERIKEVEPSYSRENSAEKAEKENMGCGIALGVICIVSSLVFFSIKLDFLGILEIVAGTIFIFSSKKRD